MIRGLFLVITMQRQRLISILLLSFFLLLLFAPLHLWGGDCGPRQQLEVSINRLLDVLRDVSLKGDEQQTLRRERIAEVVFLQFDMQRMAKLSLGRDWKALNEVERSRFTSLYRNLLKESYVATIDGYAGEKISYLKEIIKGDKAEVQTAVIRGSLGVIPLNYRLKVNEDGQWLVYDVIIENVSLVRNYRSQFGPIMNKSGFAALIDLMEKKTSQVGERKDG